MGIRYNGDTIENRNYSKDSRTGGEIASLT